MSARPARQSATAAQSRLKELILDLNNYEAKQSTALLDTHKANHIQTPIAGGSLCDPIIFDNGPGTEISDDALRKGKVKDGAKPDDWYDAPISDEYTPIPPTTKLIDQQQHAATFDQRFDSIYAMLVNKVQQYASGFFKNRMLTPENRVLWREKLVQGLPGTLMLTPEDKVLWHEELISDRRPHPQHFKRFKHKPSTSSNAFAFTLSSAPKAKRSLSTAASTSTTTLSSDFPYTLLYKGSTPSLGPCKVKDGALWLKDVTGGSLDNPIEIDDAKTTTSKKNRYAYQPISQSYTPSQSRSDSTQL